jgi:di/tricarboxylate transporter
MTLAWISTLALVVAIALSCTTAVNVGVLSLALAWLVGVYLGGLSVNTLLEGFPAPLFVTLVGVTLLFSMSESNGTLERLTTRAVRLCRGHAGALPVMFFALALVVSTIGPGATPTSALLAPPAMAATVRAGVPPLLMVIMAGNGALAGTLSPFAPTGIVADGVMARIGLGGAEWHIYVVNAVAHAVVGIVGFLVLGGWRLLVSGHRHVAAGEETVAPFDSRHWLTLGIIATLIVAVILFEANVGLTALAGATILTLARAVDEKAAIRGMPWGVILMVTGVTVLIGLLEKTQGMELFTGLIARVSTPESVTGVVAFGTGAVSLYSSTSGVVLPAFLPIAPGLAERLGGLDPYPIALSMNVGSSLVDLSPLSTTGALFLAAAPATIDSRGLFNRLLAWGVAMTVTGAVFCWLMFGYRG